MVKPIGNCCFSAKYTILMSKSNDWLAQNLDNVCKWRDMSTRTYFSKLTL